MSYVDATHRNHVSALSARSLLMSQTQAVRIYAVNASEDALILFFKCEVVSPVYAAAVSTDEPAPSGPLSGPALALCRHART